MQVLVADLDAEKRMYRVGDYIKLKWPADSKHSRQRQDIIVVRLCGVHLNPDHSKSISVLLMFPDPGKSDLLHYNITPGSDPTELIIEYGPFMSKIMLKIVKCSLQENSITLC